jgi:hypothetical protein
MGAILLRQVAVVPIRGRNPFQRMAEADLYDVRFDADALHVRRHRATEIVDNPSGNSHFLGEQSIAPSLDSTEAGDRAHSARGGQAVLRSADRCEPFRPGTVVRLRLVRSAAV